MLITMSVSADCRSCRGASGHHLGAGAGMEQTVDKQRINQERVEVSTPEPQVGNGYKFHQSMRPCLIISLLSWRTDFRNTEAPPPIPCVLLRA